ncbi:MAG: hypothetical protein NZ772_03590 [Cyanobacteria bacterium]|nr:hypothetical protein [Cyanobacteriota bacterium]MDW8200323.1 hypothetical protein [Cyanobacteriota bacterium SKYGB_h_bin112]
MSKSIDKPASDKTLLSVQNVVIAGVAWGVLALLFYLVFGTKSAGEELPQWYTIGTYVFEMVAFLCSTLLCFRNWRSPQIVSGRNVWLFIGSGTLLYFIGQGIFGYIELVLGQDPEVSVADLFFLTAYLCFIVGMMLAVFSKRLSLEIWQWLTVVGIGAAGIAIAVWLTVAKQPPSVTLANYRAAVVAQIQAVRLELAKDLPLLMPSANAQPAPPVAPPTPKASPTAPVAKPNRPALPKPVTSSPKPATGAPPQQASPTVKPTQPAAIPKAGTQPPPKLSPSPATRPTTPPVASPSPTVPEGSESPAMPVPESPVAVEEPTLLQTAVKTFYLAADVALLVMATTLLLAFWGGRFSISWRMIAAAAFSFYVADLYFQLASRSLNYQSGGVLEVGWVFSGVLFGLGAVLEYDLSTRSRRASRRRT